MIRKNTFTRAGLIAALALSVHTAQAQDIHFTQFAASPLIVNPAFTGNFDGQWRAAAVYRNQWQSVTIPFVTYAASFDMPVIHDITVDDYLAVGGQLYEDKAGDGDLKNFSGLLSVAYHKFLGGGNEPNKVLSVGFQGGYTSKSIDISKLYFGDEFVNGVFQQGTSAEYPYLNNKIHYFTVNAGVSWAHSTSQDFSYVIGIGANNLNQPQESFERKKNSEVGLGIRYTGQLGAVWYLNDKFSLRPAVLYQTQATSNELIAGNEFNMIVGNPEIRSFATNVFVGGYYRNGDAAMITAGMEFKGLRVGVSYDYNTSALKDASKGNGGFEISLRYIAPNPLTFAHKLVYPCSRF
ncbi:PorP/SprF family type IX secretion system membrane protein [Chitinophagaceae bacterium MMS25-I14]